MAINILAYAPLINTALDQQLVQGAVTGWMTANAGQVKYSGGNEIRVPKMTVEGMKNYSRDTGYPTGSVNLGWETFTLTQDRGLKITIDAMDVDETAFVATIGNAALTLNKTRTIPEIDAYRHNKLYTLANAQSQVSINAALTKATIFSALMADIAAIQNRIGTDEELVITISIPAYNLLMQATDIQRFIRADEFDKAGIMIKVDYLNGIPILKSPDTRMQTSITINDGSTAGQLGGGYSVNANSTKINWIITTRRSPIAINKHTNTKMFSPEINQATDGWLLEARMYHDLIVLDNQMAGVWVNIEAQPS